MLYMAFPVPRRLVVAHTSSLSLGSWCSDCLHCPKPCYHCQSKALGELLQIPTPSPSSVFIRENAIIFNIESLRMIITKDEVSNWTQMPLTISWVVQTPFSCLPCYLAQDEAGWTSVPGTT